MHNTMLPSVLAISLLVSKATAACSPPNIKLTVGVATFQVPIFEDCNFGYPAGVTPEANPPAPATAISASADYTKFVDGAGAALNSESTKELLAFFGQSVPIDILLEQTICTITDTENGIFVVEGETEDLNEGTEVEAREYRCIIEL